MSESMKYSQILVQKQKEMKEDTTNGVMDQLNQNIQAKDKYIRELMEEQEQMIKAIQNKEEEIEELKRKGKEQSEEYESVINELKQKIQGMDRSNNQV